MPHPLIRHERDGAIAILTIDRPAKRNAMDLPMWIALAEAMEACSADDALGCVVLRGAGEEAFCAGADIAAFATERGTPEREAVYAAEIGRSFQSLRACRHPVVAACRGWTMGGGAGLATMADFRVGGPATRIGIPARNLNIFYAYDELDPILQSVGYGVAMEMLVEGRVFTGAEAYEKGLLSRLVPDEAVQEEALAMARRIAQGAPLANRFHKRALQELRGALPISAEQYAASRTFPYTEDFREAARAFVEKRKPVFRGR
ncbi:enoyl-CoA hydratase/isomerase family protein [Falsiroseomonas selenitidurans]|uniref:Enoyl-CoA hydratase/isomerase family protein n=1 Tax=Falsiroseomonas selenitidurans TaxID=2716335 RepID=A0ABX1E8N1_9PROT|nr:enoyl-CoA hydratase-related protein [Falsiroseomonas selenitidurans]NKC33120.1 enoyl-CoA hydratase/isomerase family protein [Falsiroseomonas selenitidurans]